MRSQGNNQQLVNAVLLGASVLVGSLTASSQAYVGFQLNNLTTTQRDALTVTPLAGAVIWNTTLTSMQVYNGTSWESADAAAAVTELLTLNNIWSANSVLSSPAAKWNGTWINTGGTGTTTKPHLLLEPSGTTSTSWSLSGTGFGINAASGFAGNIFDFKVNNTTVASMNPNGFLTIAGGSGGAIFGSNTGCSFNYNAAGRCAASLSFELGANQTAADCFLTRGGAAATWQLGFTNAAVAVAQTLKVQGVLTGTLDVAGANWTLAGSIGTGTGAGGQIIVRTAPASSTGTTPNALVTAMTITAPAIGMLPSVVIGAGSAPATTDTDGFLYIPGCAGAPSGVPTAFTGSYALRWDHTNKQLYIYDGAWLQPKTPAAAAIVSWQ